MNIESITLSISEKELFAEFMRHGYFVADPFTGHPTDIEMPHDVLSDPGAYGLTSGLFDEWSADIAESDYPGSDMDCMVSDLQHFIGRLVELRSVFAQLQARREVADDTADDSRYSPRDPAWPIAVQSAHALNNARYVREGDRKRRELEREHQDDLAARRVHDAKINAMWFPFAEEQRALDVAKETLRKRWAKLPDEWDRFVIERETWGDDRAIREAAERARLEAIENELKAELGKIDQKMFELADRVHKAARPKAA